MKIGRARAALLVAVVASSVGVAVLRRPAPLGAGPVLVVRSITSDAPEPAASPGGEERAMALAAASLSPADRLRILEMIDFATARLEARLSPLGTDFEEGDPVAQLRASLAPYQPAFTAARELERGAWQSADLAVRVGASCAAAKPAPDEHCVTLRGPSHAPRDLEARARFLAWAVSHALVIDLGTRERAEARAQALRTRATLATSTIALVLLDDDLALRPTPDRADLQASANRLGRAMAGNDIHDTKDLEAFARGVEGAGVAPWLTVSRTQILVVPRLSALGRVDELRRETAP